VSDTLVEALPKEQARVRALVLQYRDPLLNGAGNIAAMLMEQDLQIADKVVIEGDIVGMVSIYKKLKEWEA
jgi:hypothetical protein